MGLPVHVGWQTRHSVSNLLEYLSLSATVCMRRPLLPHPCRNKNVSNVRRTGCWRLHLQAILFRGHLLSDLFSLLDMMHCGEKSVVRRLFVLSGRRLPTR